MQSVSASESIHRNSIKRSKLWAHRVKIVTNQGEGFGEVRAKKPLNLYRGSREIWKKQRKLKVRLHLTAKKQEAGVVGLLEASP